jgi:hypothetical protein
MTGGRLAAARQAPRRAEPETSGGAHSTVLIPQCSFHSAHSTGRAPNNCPFGHFRRGRHATFRFRCRRWAGAQAEQRRQRAMAAVGAPSRRSGGQEAPCPSAWVVVLVAVLQRRATNALGHDTSSFIFPVVLAPGNPGFSQGRCPGPRTLCMRSAEPVVSGVCGDQPRAAWPRVSTGAYLLPSSVTSTGTRAGSAGAGSAGTLPTLTTN